MNWARLRMNRWRRNNSFGEKPKWRWHNRSTVRWLAATRAASWLTLVTSGSTNAVWIARMRFSSVTGRAFN